MKAIELVKFPLLGCQYPYSQLTFEDNIAQCYIRELYWMLMLALARFLKLFPIPIWSSILIYTDRKRVLAQFLDGL